MLRFLASIVREALPLLVLHDGVAWVVIHKALHFRHVHDEPQPADLVTMVARYSNAVAIPIPIPY